MHLQDSKKSVGGDQVVISKIQQLFQVAVNFFVGNVVTDDQAEPEGGVKCTINLE